MDLLHAMHMRYLRAMTLEGTGFALQPGELMAQVRCDPGTSWLIAGFLIRLN